MTIQPSSARPLLRGRGTAHNPENRFDRFHVEPDRSEEPAQHTLVRREQARSILARNKSPDIPFSYSLNPYRGCEHGCVYCYARPTHEYLGFSSGLDFETRLIAKINAPELLRETLCAETWVPTPIFFSGVTDAYQPIERELKLTRGCLEVIAELKHPVSIITKSRLVIRDIDLLAELAEHDASSVMVSLTTLDSELHQHMEPRAAHPERRLQTIRDLADAGVPVGVMTAPLIPGLNDSEMPALLKAAAQAGATFAGYTVLRLPGAVAQLFGAWLQEHFPDRASRVLARLRDMRGGDLSASRFRTRMRGEGDGAKLLSALFKQSCRRVHLSMKGPTLSTEAFERPGEQLSLF